MRINGETIRAKEHRREEEKMADLRDLEYMKNKMVRLINTLRQTSTCVKLGWTHRASPDLCRSGRLNTKRSRSE